MNSPTDTKKLWASRFEKETDPVGLKYCESLTVDRHMIPDDLWGNLAHVIMLGKCKIVEETHVQKILGALLKIYDLHAKGQWDLNPKDEDVQMNVERAVINDVGMESGGRMHTGRSRNDQVPLDTKMYARRRILDVYEKVLTLNDNILELASHHYETYMPGYTHIQHAQPITFAYWLTNYVAVFQRDLERLQHAFKNMNANPLGAGAIAGTSFPIDRKLTTTLLGFDSVQEHGLDVVGSRDYTLETLSALSNIMTTTSRVAEEIIFWITHEFRTLALDDSFGMGSSMMPQKKNPGVLELMRARAGKMNGYLVAMLTTLKGTHSGYNRDLHEDKVVLVDGLSLCHDTVEVLGRVVKTLQVNKSRMLELTEGNFAAATELANYLVTDHNIPFRECHRIVGYVVGALVKEGKNFTHRPRTQELLNDKGIKVSSTDLQNILGTAEVVSRQKSQGGCAPQEVKRMTEAMMTQNKTADQWYKNTRTQLDSARSSTFEIASNIATGSPLEKALKHVHY